MKINIISNFFAVASVFSIFSMTSCTQKFDQEIYDANFDIKPADVTELTIVPTITNKIKADLSWVLPTEYIESIEISGINEDTEEVMFTENISKNETSWSIYDLDENINYRFLVQTVKKNGTKSLGATITYSYANSDLTGYKSDLLAYDFGYISPDDENFTDGKITRTFKYKYPYTSKYSIDINKLYLKSVSGNKNAFEIVDYSPKFLIPGTTCEFTVSYKPDYSQKTWDEAEFFYSEDDNLNVCLIASTFKQPKNINPEHLKLWLRPDFVTKSSINSANRCIMLPDFSGNHYNATTYTHLQYSGTTNEGPIYTISDEKFNNLPVLYYTSGGLRASGNICHFSSSMLNNNQIDSKMGTTAFVAYRPVGKLNAFFLSCYNGFSNSFPLFGTLSRNWDTTKGWNATAKYHPAISGIGVTTGRFFFKPDFNEENLLKNDYNTPIESRENSAHIMIARSVYKNYSQTTYTGISGTGYDYRITSYPDYDINKSYDLNNGVPHLFKYYRTYNLYNSKYWYYGVPVQNYMEGWYDGKKYNLAFTGSCSKVSDSLTSIDNATSYATGEPWGTSDNENEVYPFLNEHAKDILNRAFEHSSYNSPALPSYASYFNNNLSASPEQMSVSEIFLGKSYTNTTDSNFYIADVIIYDQSLTDEEIAQINNYIYYRWGIGSLMTE